VWFEDLDFRLKIALRAGFGHEAHSAITGAVYYTDSPVRRLDSPQKAEDSV